MRGSSLFDLCLPCATMHAQTMLSLCCCQHFTCSPYATASPVSIQALPCWLRSAKIMGPASFRWSIALPCQQTPAQQTTAARLQAAAGCVSRWCSSSGGTGPQELGCWQQSTCTKKGDCCVVLCTPSMLCNFALSEPQVSKSWDTTTHKCTRTHCSSISSVSAPRRARPWCVVLPQPFRKDNHTV